MKAQMALNPCGFQLEKKKCSVEKKSFNRGKIGKGNYTFP